MLVTWTGFQISSLAICGLSCLLPALIRFILFAHCINSVNPIRIFLDTSSIQLNAAVHPTVSSCTIARPLRIQKAEFFNVKADGKSKNH
jgi:hypothetical protein